MDEYSTTKDSDSNNRLSVVKSRSKRATECEEDITRVLQDPLRTMSGKSNVVEIICKSCGKQLYGFVDGYYKIDNKSILKNIDNNKCENGIEVKIPVRVGCKGGC